MSGLTDKNTLLSANLTVCKYNKKHSGEICFNNFKL